MIKEPIYSSTLSLNLNEAWNKIMEFSKEISKKEINKENDKIVLNASYVIRFFTYFTWVDGVTILLKSLNDNETMINIYGKVLLSPHHILRLVTLNKKRINKDTFLNNVQIFFKKYETVITTKEDNNYKKEIAFWFLECSSILIFSFILIQIFLLHIQSSSSIVTISFVLFLCVQAPLIIWLTRDCYNRNDLSNRRKNKWITFICMTGFIGCFFYFLVLLRGHNAGRP